MVVIQSFGVFAFFNFPVFFPVFASTSHFQASSGTQKPTIHHGQSVSNVQLKFCLMAIIQRQSYEESPTYPTVTRLKSISSSLLASLFPVLIKTIVRSSGNGIPDTGSFLTSVCVPSTPTLTNLMNR